MLAATPAELAPLARELRPAAGGAPRPAPAWPPAEWGEVAGVPVALASSGLGKANAAAAVAAFVAGSRGGVRAVLQVGVGGVYPGAALPLGGLAAAASERDLDLGAGRHPEWRDLESLAVPGDATRNLLDLGGPHLAAATAAASVPALPFGTSDSVTADEGAAAYLRQRFGVAVESMEGAGAARAAAHLGVPFVELRGVSNVVGERDRSAWRLPAAVAAACRAAAAALPALWEATDEPAR